MCNRTQKRTIHIVDVGKLPSCHLPFRTMCFSSKTNGTHSKSLEPAQQGQNSNGQNPYIVVVFGRTGVGVSSLVNLIVGSPVAQWHGDTRPCTQQTMAYTAAFAGKQFCVYDIPGYGGGFTDTEITEIIQDIKSKKGIDMLVYCLRKKRDTMMPSVFREIRHVVPQKVPMVGVVTELERQEGSVESWWTKNGETLEKMGITFDEHACVTTLAAEEVTGNERFSEFRLQSQEAVRGILARRCEGAKR